MVSEICAAFHAAPSAAEAQPWPLTAHVLDYRNAVHARDLFDQGAKGFESLRSQPHLMRLLLAMHRAQVNAEATMDDALADAAERAREADERRGDDA